MGNEHHSLDDIWPALEPPQGFGERVLQALEHGPPAEVAPPLPAPAIPARPRPRRERMLWLTAGICAGAVAAAGILLLRPTGAPPFDGTRSGYLIVDVRQTLTIGDRGLAVAERGAELAWFVVAGNPRVEQQRGSVFYRLDRGGPFTVATPVGDVRVTGTCFRVSVGPDPDHPPAVVATVEVMEGSVVLEASDRTLGGSGELPLAAGEMGRMSLHAAPTRVDAEAANRRPEVNARIRQLEHALYEARRAPDRKQDAGDRLYDPSPDDLRAMAQRCEMRYYLPRHLTSLDAPSLSDAVDVSPEQRAAIVRLMEEHRAQYVAALQGLYSEVTGDRAIAMRLSPKSLQEDLFAKLEPQALQDARRRIVGELADGTPPGPSRSAGGPAERFMRLHSGAGEAFFRKLVDLLGLDLAREIREKTTSDILTFSPAFHCRKGP
jgi:ferric-dicitrate binding protein FerR (iron transport regulator)